ncbi:MAG: aldo/keto reductase [Candidatus Sumerlaeota bacterium]|nr:aldo/keto reductase [Candidatus Sumerlaeota bacterium]
MEHTILGRTGLRASVAGLGAGGPSRLGRSTHKNDAESVRVVRAALDSSVNLIDTAEGYTTEDIVGKAIQGVARDRVILSTKKTIGRSDKLPSSQDVVLALENSLRRLGVEYVDIYHAHGVRLETYGHVREEIVPAFLKLRDQGKIRFLGVTEHFSADTGHAMLQQALRDDCWDVVMVGFNLLNQTARERVFPLTIAKRIGTLIMFAVRRALSQPAFLRQMIADLKARGKIGADDVDSDDSLGFLVRPGGAADVVDAAYRFCRHEPGADVILTGTGSVEHLMANIKSLNGPDLSAEDRRWLREIFARVDDVTG